MTHSTYPSIDAAKHYEPLLQAAEEAARIQAQDLSAARISTVAIQSIPDIDFTPAVVAQLCAVLSSRIAKSNWSHFTEGQGAMETLDGLHDQLEGV